MRERTWTIASAVVFLCLLGERQTPLQAQGVPLPVEELPLAKDLSVPSGQTVTPVYEGWYQNPDGSYSIVFRLRANDASGVVGGGHSRRGSQKHQLAADEGEDQQRQQE